MPLPPFARVRPVPRAGIRALALLCLGLALSGCGASASPGVRLALDGPELAIAGEMGGRVYEGRMERSCMAGVGNIVLHDPASRTVCRGVMDAPGSQKGRLYAELACTDGRGLYLILRNLGPDQGMGVGRFAGETRRMTLFYHACPEEARRRLEQVRRELETLDPTGGMRGNAPGGQGSAPRPAGG